MDFDFEVSKDCKITLLQVQCNYSTRSWLLAVSNLKSPSLCFYFLISQ